MLKQLLTGGSILALLLVGSISTEAKTQEPMLQSQVQDVPSSTPAPDGSTTTPGVDAPATPAPEDSITAPAPDGSTTTPGVDAPATPAPEDSITAPAPDGSTTTPGVDAPTTTPAPEDSITAPAPDGSTTTPGVDTPTTTPAPEGVTSPEAGVSDTGLCESISPAGASGGATRARLQALESCTKQIN
ncbi:hypothetical protein [Chroococcidiopsis sp. CCMEE 29]|uniref:hypothetical protein n=1 Tax=Chroococcidiopsis sp. CCMEE 29 TaxID=155894 RepID=UPI002021EB50|nr:hypothetical protein [Chroococcidiopsis sp. CCMEE 29]